MTDLSPLIERVRAASGPDREIDALVGVFVGAEPKIKTHYKRGVYINGKPVVLRMESIYPAYTASLDAVVALIEKRLPGRLWTVSTSGPDGSVYGWVGLGAEAAQLSSTPALALLLAFLTAVEGEG